MGYLDGLAQDYDGVRFCWFGVKDKCECPEESPGNLVEYARNVFLLRWPRNDTRIPVRNYEYDYDGKGSSDNKKTGDPVTEPGPLNGKSYEDEPLNTISIYKTDYYEINCYWLVRYALSENDYDMDNIYWCPRTVSNCGKGDIIQYV